MKTKLLAILLNMFVCLTVAAQTNLTFKQSEELKDRYTYSEIVRAVDDTKGGHYVLRRFIGQVYTATKGFQLMHYDADMKLLEKHDFEDNFEKIVSFYLKDNMVYVIGMEKTDKKRSTL